jgi:uridine kinase
MKYIITEEQNEKIRLLRRIDQDWKWIIEIVKEGLDMYNPCSYESKEDYLDTVSKSSSDTYVLSYFHNWQKETFSQLSEYIKSLIIKRLGDDIIEHFEDLDLDCEDKL